MSPSNIDDTERPPAFPDAGAHACGPRLRGRWRKAHRELWLVEELLYGHGNASPHIRLARPALTLIQIRRTMTNSKRTSKPGLRVYVFCTFSQPDRAELSTYQLRVS